MAARIAEFGDSGGRLFILGVGGSAGNAGHAVNDFRKLCDVESYAPTDNVSELTARTNDEEWSLPVGCAVAAPTRAMLLNPSWVAATPSTMSA